VLIFGLN
jgi:hypothetical protein